MLLETNRMVKIILCDIHHVHKKVLIHEKKYFNFQINYIFETIRIMNMYVHHVVGAN